VWNERAWIQRNPFGSIKVLSMKKVGGGLFCLAQRLFRTLKTTTESMNQDDSIFVAGHRGMVGSALVRDLLRRGYTNLLLPSRDELDLTRQDAVTAFFARERPKVVLMAAAKVGGIHANSTFSGEFIYQNLIITTHLVEAARQSGTERLLFLGSSCIYPKHAPQPMPEECLLSSPLEPTNEAYAIAKIAGLKLCQHYRRQYGLLFHSLMPTNLYGPGDNYHPENSHVLPALIRRFYEAREDGAKEVVVWGSGKVRREFLYVDDLAEACHFLLQTEDPPDWINVGSGIDLTIRELAELVREVVGFDGDLAFDATKPDGTPRKLLDVSRMSDLGWRATTALREGLESTYQAFQKELADSRVRAE
jgi:GDP-L-fucose synthase